MDFIIKKITEPGTINGVFLLAGLAGVSVSPDLQTPIVSVLGSIAAIYNIVRKG